jgi:TRAP-type C4-dicarboxylate transport system permease small subunit
MAKPSVHESKHARLGAAGWLAIAAMGIVLGAAIWFMFYGWNLTDAQISTQGYIALTLGIVLSIVVGGGLMALLFWSNRKGYDR